MALEEVTTTVTLEEDDEFEEFEQQEWNAAEEDLADAERWEDDWDDDDVSDDFAKQLRTELEKVSKIIQK
jgi:26 proteasome complex subunit DSS1